MNFEFSPFEAILEIFSIRFVPISFGVSSPSAGSLFAKQIISVER